MAYNFGIINIVGFNKAKQWLKAGYGVLQNGKPPVDDAVDNNYQNYSDSITGLGAIPSFKALNASNQFEVNCGHAVVDNALTVAALAAPATPTAVVNGTTGATTYTYLVVGRSGNLQAKSATVSKTTGNATLSAVNSITLTWAITPGYLVYDVYRTAGGATQGMIGTAAFQLGPNVSTPTLSFTDTGLKGDSTTAPTVNSTGAVVGDLNVYGNLTALALATPATPLVTPAGTTGAATWSYKIVARSSVGSHTAASSAGSTSTGNATLTSVNNNVITWQPVPGAYIYDVYRTAVGTAPTTTGLIGSTQGRTFTDTGVAGDSTTAPTTNNTGSIGGGAGVSPQFSVTPNYIATENGANNAIATAAASGPTLTTGLVVTVQLAHTLQAGANTFAYNGGSALSIKKHFNVATDLSTVYAATGVIQLFYNGTLWLDLSQ